MNSRNSRQRKAYWRHPATEAIKWLLQVAFLVSLGLIIAVLTVIVNPN